MTYSQVILKSVILDRSLKLGSSKPAHNLDKWSLNNKRYSKQPETYMPNSANYVNHKHMWVTYSHVMLSEHRS